MDDIWPIIRRLRSNCQGNVLAEYALIAVLIGVIILASIENLGSSVSALFATIGNSVRF